MDLVRLFELLLIALLLAAGAAEVLRLGKTRARWLRGFFVLICVVAACHLWLEGWRLQMLPAYLSIIPLGVLCYGRVSGVAGRILLTGCLTIGAVVSGAAGYIFPVFVLPTPQGPYGIGTFVSYLVDHSRHERHASSPDAPRELMIQVWYPAERVNGTRAWYRDPRVNTWRSQHLRLVKTHSYWNLPVADQPRTFPVVIFSPSAGGNRDQNTFQVEELASQGYVVVGIDHPYSSSRVVFPDGRVVYALPWIDTSNRETLETSTRRVELMVNDHVADVRFVLDEMERWNQPGSAHRLASRLDLKTAGIIGHSFGGALAAAACLSEPRILAGINMDGWMFGEAEETGIPKPFFFMEDDISIASLTRLANMPAADRVLIEREIEHKRAIQSSLDRYGGYNLTIIGARHFTYADMALFSPLSRFSGNGPVNAQRVHQIINAFTLAFFDRYLRHKSSALLDEGGFPGEIRYQGRRAPTAAGSP